MEKKFLEINHDIFLLQPDKIAVAVSGGADSLSLVFLLKELFKELNTKIYSFTVDHGLRESSTLEALNNKQLLNSYGISNEILTWHHQGDITSNIQSIAREARYNLLITKCLELDIKYLFVGHTLDDVAENFLIRLRRGSGLDGLAAIKRTIAKQNVEIIRPLLSFAKLEIKNYLLSLGIKWFEDPSNRNTDFERVKVRNMLQGEELLSKRIATAASHLRMVKDYVEASIKQIEKKIVNYDENFHVIKIDLKNFLSLGEYERYTILSNSLQLIGSKIYKPRFERLTQVIQAIMNGTLKNFNLHSCIVTLFKRQYIIICSEANKNISPLDKEKIRWGNIYEISLNTFKNFQDLTITSLQQSGWQNFENKDIILDATTQSYPKIVFYALPVIKRLEKIVSIPHLNYYSHESYKEIKILTHSRINF